MKSENELTVEDREVCLLVMDIIPELRIAALAVEKRRERGVEYPVDSLESIAGLYDCEEITIDGHKINGDMLKRYMSDVFPIRDDAQLARAVYLALCRCNTDMAWALQAPSYARELLDEIDRFKTMMKRGERDA